MTQVIKIVFLSLLFVSLLSGCSESVTEDSIHRVMDGMERSIENRDAEGVARYLSNDVDIELTVEMQGEKQIFTPSKSEYTQMLHDSWQSVTQYDYTTSDLNIELNGSYAMVTVDMEESFTMKNGLTLSSVGSEILTLEYVGSRLMISKIVAETKVKL